MVPQRFDGDTIDPSVSVPTEKATRPADVDEADPALDPEFAPGDEAAADDTGEDELPDEG